MVIFPAIDVKGGRCVRLYKGDYQTAEEVAPGIEEAVDRFRAAGARYLHLVDLDGAKDPSVSNAGLIALAAARSGMYTEVGGGIRDMAAIERYLELGLSRVILGSAAYEDRALLREACGRWGERVAVGIDARERRVALHGWLTDTETDFIDFARECEQAGAGAVIFTDIGRDGTLEGPNIGQLTELKRAVGCAVTASGGIRDLKDLRALERAGLDAAIVGKAVYTGALDLAEALKALEGRD